MPSFSALSLDHVMIVQRKKSANEFTKVWADVISEKETLDVIGNHLEVQEISGK